MLTQPEPDPEPADPEPLPALLERLRDEHADLDRVLVGRALALVCMRAEDIHGDTPRTEAAIREVAPKALARLRHPDGPEALRAAWERANAPAAHDPRPAPRSAPRRPLSARQAQPREEPREPLRYSHPGTTDGPDKATLRKLDTIRRHLADEAAKRPAEPLGDRAAELRAQAKRRAVEEAGPDANPASVLAGLFR